MDTNSTSCRAPPKQVNQCVYATCECVCVCMYRTALQYQTFSDMEEFSKTKMEKH